MIDSSARIPENTLERSSSGSLRSRLTPYFVALGVAIASVAIRYPLDPWLGPTRAAFLIPFCAITFVAVFYGFLPAVATEILCGLGVVFFILPPRHTFEIEDPEMQASIVTFAAATFVCAILGSFVHRARQAKDALADELRQNEAALRAANEHLESKVEERTHQLVEANSSAAEEAELRLREQRQRGDLLKRLTESQESERARIGRDIHDHLGQRLTALRLQLQSLRQEMDRDPAGEAARSRVESLETLTKELDAEVSYLAWELRPTVLDQLGLVETLRLFVTEWSKQNGVDGEFQQHGQVAFDKETETHLYRITQEALNNIAKHAGAKNVSVQLGRGDGMLSLIIDDDGKGFVPKSEPRHDGLGGLGLRGMKERAELCGGKIEIQSKPGSGTTVFVRLAELAKGAGQTSGRRSQDPGL